LDPYVLDFYCHERKLAVELDGSQHTSSEAQRYDGARDAFLRAKGIRVCRISVHDFLDNVEGALKVIVGMLREER
jgi:very-short-patch-repair endonuclease